MNKKISFYLRRTSQFIVVLLVFYLTLRHLNLGIEKAFPIDAYCPFGGVESFLTYISTGEFLKRIFLSSFALLIITIFLTIFFGRVFCGYFCPLGALQEFFRWLGKKIGIKKDFEFPKNIDYYARYLKYFILILIIFFSYKLGDLIFRNYDPYNALMHLGNEWEEKIFGYIILLVLLLASLFTKSFWCRYFCPLGAILGIFKKISFFKLKRDEHSCVSCHSCDYNCPAGLEIEKKKQIKSADCISCLNCVEKCPNNSLSISVFGKKITKNNFSILVVIIFVLAILISSFSPLWQKNIESNIKDTVGQISPENIRGSNTLNFVIKETGISLNDFQKEFSLPEDVNPELMLKEIGSKYNIKNKSGDPLETEDFREFISNNLKSKK